MSVSINSESVGASNTIGARCVVIAKFNTREGRQIECMGAIFLVAKVFSAEHESPPVIGRCVCDGRVVHRVTALRQVFARIHFEIGLASVANIPGKNKVAR